MEATLKLIFTAAGSNVTVSLKSPLDTLTPEQVQPVVDDILAKKAFVASKTGAPIDAFKEAYIRTTDTKVVIE